MTNSTDIDSPSSSEQKVPPEAAEALYLPTVCSLNVTSYVFERGKHDSKPNFIFFDKYTILIFLQLAVIL